MTGDPLRLGHELAARFGVAHAEAALAALLVELRDDEHAPTPIREPEAASGAHLADSLVALALPRVTAAHTVADLGSGAGFPGLALAATLPAATVTLIESVSRKAAFIARAAESAGLHNVRVADVRAEQWPEGLGSCDLVTARALAALPVLVEYAAPLLVEGGALVAWKGRRHEDEEAAGARAALLLGLELEEIRAVQPHPGAGERHLYVYSKVRPTPAGYPRRPGMAAKRPLGATNQPRPTAEVSQIPADAPPSDRLRS